MWVCGFRSVLDIHSPSELRPGDTLLSEYSCSSPSSCRRKGVSLPAASSRCGTSPRLALCQKLHTEETSFCRQRVVRDGK